MKNILFNIGLIGALISISGCGGAGTGGASLASLMAQTPVEADGPSDTAALSLVDTGATGFISIAHIGSSSPELAHMKVRLSSDYSTAFISINGGAEFLLSGTGGSTGGAWGSPPKTLSLANSTDTSLVAYSNGTQAAFGFVGIQTPVAALGSGTSTFSGFYGGHVYPTGLTGTFDVDSGFLDMTVNFGTGDVTGTMSDISVDVGTISGSLTGSGMSGSMTFTGGNYLGTVDFAAALFGDTPDEVAGAFAGVVTNATTSESQQYVGTITAN